MVTEQASRQRLDTKSRDGLSHDIRQGSPHAVSALPKMRLRSSNKGSDRINDYNIMKSRLDDLINSMKLNQNRDFGSCDRRSSMAPYNLNLYDMQEFENEYEDDELLLESFDYTETLNNGNSKKRKVPSRIMSNPSGFPAGHLPAFAAPHYSRAQARLRNFNISISNNARLRSLLRRRKKESFLSWNRMSSKNSHLSDSENQSDSQTNSSSSAKTNSTNQKFEVPSIDHFDFTFPVENFNQSFNTFVFDEYQYDTYENRRWNQGPSYERLRRHMDPLLPSDDIESDISDSVPSDSSKNHHKAIELKLRQVARRRRHMQRIANNEIKSEKDGWVCYICEYEALFGSVPYYLLQKVDQRERLGPRIAAERRRLLEKAKGSGRKFGARFSKKTPSTANDKFHNAAYTGLQSADIDGRGEDWQHDPRSSAKRRGIHDDANNGYAESDRWREEFQKQEPNDGSLIHGTERDSRNEGGAG